MMELGKGIYPDEARVVLIWNEPSKTETPIHVTLGETSGSIYPQVPVKVPANVASMLHDDSGYDVSIFAIEGEPVEVAAPDEDEIEQAVVNVELAAQAQALIGQSIAKLKESLAGADIDLLEAALAAEQAEGDGKTRVGAIEAIQAAIDELNEQAS